MESYYSTVKKQKYKDGKQFKLLHSLEHVVHTVYERTIAYYW